MHPDNPHNYLSQLLRTDPDGNIDQKRDSRPTEQTIVDSLVRTVQRNEKVWAESEVNLWSEKAKAAGQSVPPQEALRDLGHPLQPDIDILLGEADNGERNPPLVGIEAKYFGKYRGIRGHELLPKRVGPEGNSMGGFYSGLGQALSLLSMGLDYVYLWHVFEIDETIYRSGSDESDQTRDHRDILETYTERIIEILKTYELPIGYFAHGMATEFENQLIYLNSHPPKSETTGPTSTSTDVRRLLDRTLTDSTNSRNSDEHGPDTRTDGGTLADLSGTGEQVTVEAEIVTISFIKKDVPDMPDVKGILGDTASSTKLPFVVDTDVSHPFLETGMTYRFENATDHLYERQDEVQLRVTEQTTITEQ